MPTLEAIESTLPWGLHDAVLEGLSLDFVGSRLTLDVRLMMTTRQEMDRRARVHVAGLAWSVVEAPTSRAQGESPISAGRLTDAEERWADRSLPPVPPDCFGYWLFLQDWDAFIFFAARDATMEWIEAAPVAARPIRGP